MEQSSTNSNQGIISKVVEKFLDGKLSIMLIITAVCLGVAALLVTPREEERRLLCRWQISM